MANISPPPYTTEVTNKELLITNAWSKWFSDIHAKIQKLEYLKLDSLDLSGLNSGSFTSQISNTYSSYKIELVDVVMTSSNDQIKFRASTNAGSTWDTRSAGYSWLHNKRDVTGTTVASTDVGNSADSSISLTATDIANSSSSSLEGTVIITNPSKITSYKHIQYTMSYIDSDALLQIIEGQGLSNQTSALNGFKLYCANNTFASGTAILYGRI